MTSPARGAGPCSKEATVDVTISPDAQRFIAARGGVVYVRVAHTRCCSGTLTRLEAATSAPRDADSYAPWPTPGADLRFRGGPTIPSELLIELTGRLRPRLAAYWDGCAYRL
jgi:hypothetical protein